MRSRLFARRVALRVDNLKRNERKGDIKTSMAVIDSKICILNGMKWSFGEYNFKAFHFVSQFYQNLWKRRRRRRKRKKDKKFFDLKLKIILISTGLRMAIFDYFMERKQNRHLLELEEYQMACMQM